MEQQRASGVIMDRELAKRLPEYGSEAIEDLHDGDLQTLYANVVTEMKRRPHVGDNPVVASYIYHSEELGAWIVRRYLNGMVDGAAVKGNGLTPGFEPVRGAWQFKAVERFIEEEM